jgi:N-acetylmuramoyl-L-alanine amidase
MVPRPFRSDREFEIVQQTIYAEARGEPLDGQKAVAWVIYNRSQIGGYFGSTMEEVCLKPQQFECWLPHIKAQWYPPRELGVYNTIGGWLKTVFQGKDYSNGADHYNNPSKEGNPPWTRNCVETVRFGGHVFYKAR